MTTPVICEACRPVQDGTLVELCEYHATLQARCKALNDMMESEFRDVLFIRCLAHRGVPQYNTQESTGAECAACEVVHWQARCERLEALRVEWIKNTEALQAERDELFHKVAKLEDDNTRLLAALAALISEWGNRGEETSLHTWNQRMKAAIYKAKQATGEIPPDGQALATTPTEKGSP